jgi:hypothetical protein
MYGEGVGASESVNYKVNLEELPEVPKLPKIAEIADMRVIAGIGKPRAHRGGAETRRKAKIGDPC